MAVGAVALNFVAVGPAVLVGGLMTKSQGKKAITNAKAQQAKIVVANAELDQADTRLDAIDARTNELSEFLTRISQSAAASLDELESEPFDAQVHAGRFRQAITLVMAVRDIVATPIIDDAGDLTAESTTLTMKYRPMAEGPIND